jgi:hypothetical protein
VDWHVLSRIADAGIDYTQRSNKIAHHIVFEPGELPPAGPAALLACESRFYRAWDGEPKLITKPTPFPQVTSPLKVCNAWERITGDAGWAGVLAETAHENRQVNLIMTPEMDALALLEEALTLLPPDLRWQTTLTTCATSATTNSTRFSSGISCCWRCILTGSPEMSLIGLMPDALVIDLTVSGFGLQALGKTPVPNPLVKAARSGKAPHPTVSPKPLYLDVGKIAGLSAVLDAERQCEGREERDEVPLETVPVAKAGKKTKTPKLAKPSKHDTFHETRERWLSDTKTREKWGLLLLIGIGLLFLGVPALLIAAMVIREKVKGKR